MLYRTMYVTTLIGFTCAVNSPANGQCAQPDGLGVGPCCTTTSVSLPQFPAVTHNNFGICWRDCDVEQLATYTAEWGAPHAPLAPGGTGPSCRAFFMAKLRLSDAATGATAWVGAMNLTYSRTWMETDTAGNDMQVWRLLVNGDMRPTTAAGPAPCPVPPCAAAHNNRVRFTGYIDYARDCATGAYSSAWMLNHGCDSLDHAPSFPRAGVFHPDRAYTFVGPSAGFAIGPIQPVASGGTSLESVRRIRRVTGSGPALCEYEEQVDAGLDVQQQLCLCGTPNGPFQYVISDLGLGSSCATSIFTPGGPFLPGYVSMGIGSWVDPSTYPGLETVRWSCGGYDYFDPCVGTTRQEVFFGVTTLQGNFAFQAEAGGFPLPRTFFDQANSLKQYGNTTIMNMPFQSDHIINLNFP